MGETKASIEWRKACECVGATATWNETRLSQPTEARGGFVFNVVRYTGPSCDDCGKPWEIVPTPSEVTNG